MESISAIIGRNPQAVEKILGPVEKKSIMHDKRAAGSPKRYYQKGAIEIVFINNTADWITITNKENKPVEEFISLYGLKELKPYFDFSGTVRYENVAGLKELTLSNNAQGRIWRVYLQAFTV